MKSPFQILPVIVLFSALLSCNSVPEKKASVVSDTTATAVAAKPVLDTSVITKDQQAAMSWQDALQRLKDGNARFTQGKMLQRDWMKGVQKTASGQYPYAVVLSCIDSRASSEVIFDQGMGDIFNCRIAGNFVNTDMLGSMEFACKVAGAKLIAVVGHTNCGAIKGACDNVKLGNLTSVIQAIQPAVKAEKNFPGDHSSKNHDYVEAVAKQNVLIAMQQIRDKSPVLRAMIDSGKVGLVGGMYDITTGTVTFY